MREIQDLSKLREINMIIILLAVILLTVLYTYGIQSLDYWKKRGVKHEKPLPFIGNSLSNILVQKSFTQVATELYWKYPNEKVVGFYRMLRPELVIRDPEIIKRILATDFTHFYRRGIVTNRKVIEPLQRNLFTMDGDTWRLLRQRLTPAFTSGKLKAMFPLIVERAEKLQMRVLEAASSGRILDSRDLMARYTTDFIGACGFGVDADSLNDEKSPFRKLGVSIVSPTFKSNLIQLLKILFPDLLKNVKVRPDVERDVVRLVKDILQQRNYQLSGRNDFIDLLLDCKSKGTLIGESIEKTKPDGTPEIATMEIDDVLIAAQAFVFFAAGFETSSSASSFTLHQLAYNPDVQHKVQEEIDRVLSKHNNVLSYDAIKEMTYLECTFKEGMRMFPSVGFLFRQCVGKYTIPEVNLTIDDGVQILIPVQALHTDPQYFDNPEQFLPDRFLPENVNSMKNKYVYLPFGIGPRACIGERLGLMQSLAGLAAVLSKSTVKPAQTTLRHPRVDPKSVIVQIVDGGLPLQFVQRNMTNGLVKN